MKHVPFYLFITIGIINVVAVTVNLEFVNLLSKPLIMVSLVGYYWTQAAKSGSCEDNGQCIPNLLCWQ